MKKRRPKMTKGTGGNKSDCCNAQVIYKNKKDLL